MKKKNRKINNKINRGIKLVNTHKNKKKYLNRKSTLIKHLKL
jgi:hypothetical protein